MAVKAPAKVELRDGFVTISGAPAETSPGATAGTAYVTIDGDIEAAVNLSSYR